MPEVQNEIKEERVILAGLDSDLFTDEETATEASLDELEALLKTAGGVAVARVMQHKAAPDPHSFLGEGKVEEIRELAESVGASMLIMDNPLSPSQIRALEDMTGLTVLDRSALILDIFAQRAKTREGRLQVELAQYQYLLPRLSGMGTSLSRLGGGIGTRGPGETKLETDRRHIRDRIHRLQEEIGEVRRVRGVQRERREHNSVPVAALVGYTNVGKSTILNLLTDAGIPANNRLFDTLDTTTRQLHVSDTLDILLSDTVGFISKLPHDLVAAFQATLEELKYADVLLHVADASDPELEKHVEVADKLIEQLTGGSIPVIYVYNKCDIADGTVLPRGENVVHVSARTGAGIDVLLRKIEEQLARKQHHAVFLLPYAMAGQVEVLHRQAKVLRCDYTGEGIEIETVCDDLLYGRLRDFVREEL